jgi:ERCC4-type nuclease
MIYIDDRVGSGELLPTFQSHRTSPPCQLSRLIAGDMCFSGNGITGTCMVGVERKRLKDMLNSIRSGRFSGEQLPKLVDQYEYSYLIVEGIWRCNWDNGVLEELWGNGWMPVRLSKTGNAFVALELQSFLNTITTHTGVYVLYSSSERDTVDQVVGLERYYSKPWDKHHGHLALHTPPQHVLLGKAGTVRRVAAALDGVGWEKSSTVAEYFKSVMAMVDADVKEWMKLPGFGKVLANRVWKELHGEYESNGDTGGIEL